jgi:N6-adenosine-specific RNA methylase IME4
LINFPNKKYNIIYADPPWKPVDSGTGMRGTADLKKRYDGIMTTDEICSLPVKDICEDISILFLWVTFPRLLDGLKVIEAWGFEYYGLGFSWVKRNRKSNSYFWGMGFYTRQNCEICLIGVKEDKKLRIKPVVHDVHSVIDCPVMEHSRKPNETREKIVKICGDLPRIELFSRESCDGWDSWGNEIEKFDKKNIDKN